MRRYNTGRRTDKEVDKKTEINRRISTSTQTNRKMDGVDGQRSRRTKIHKQTNRQTNTRIDRQVDKLSDIQTDRQPGKQV